MTTGEDKIKQMVKAVAEEVRNEPIPKPKTNCWFFHDWSRWETIHAYSVLRGLAQRNVGSGITQLRTCSRCGKQQLREEVCRIPSP